MHTINLRWMYIYLFCGSMIYTCPSLVHAETKRANEMQQQTKKRITGTIVDATNEPIIGASVLEKGTTNGTITDMDGNFVLEVSAQATLVVSYIGYKQQELAVRSRSSFSITMQEDNEVLDEIVVIGYGSMKKRDLTGAITTVKSEDITLNPASNPMQALQGKVAGLDITRESGQAGSEVKMQLRGNRSFKASGNPTFIIDGMPGNYETLNPNDIESIEVLKDAASTAVYGSSGANGVVIITTKSGRAGKIEDQCKNLRGEFINCYLCLQINCLWN